MKKYLLLTPFFSPFAFAESLLEQNTDPVSFERDVQAVKFEQNFAKNQQNPTAYLPENALKQSIEQQINNAILAQNWQKLESLLHRYAEQSNIDLLLLDYGRAALAYGKKDYQTAIAYYQALLSKQPNLVYPRFDLALILAENQQFRQAEKEFAIIRSQLPKDLAQIANRTLFQITEKERWQPDFYLQYTQTDNVNNASPSPIVNVNGRIFRKDPESLPQSAKGVRYGIGFGRIYNLLGNHFLGVDLGYNGIYYWNNQDYREQSLSFSPNYSYRTARYRVAVSPFIEQNWLGSSRYNYQFGATLSGLRHVQSNLLLSGSFTHLQKRYFDELTARRYNAYQHQITAGVQWQAVEKWRFFANLNASREIAQEKAQSSNKWLGKIGVMYQGKHFATQASIGFGKRYFADKHYLFGYKRQDKEYQANLSVWNQNWHWQGMVPKLNFRYQKIESNIADFYSRDNKELFFTLEKLF